MNGEGVGAGWVGLSEPECRQLLQRATLGHLATTNRSLPVVVPVAIRSGGSDLLLAPLVAGVAMPPLQETVVALSVSNLSVAPMGAGRGWSVHCQGMLVHAPRQASPECCRFVAQIIAGWRIPQGYEPLRAAR